MKNSELFWENFDKFMLILFFLILLGIEWHVSAHGGNGDLLQSLDKDRSDVLSAIIAILGHQGYQALRERYQSSQQPPQQSTEEKKV